MHSPVGTHGWVRGQRDDRQSPSHPRLARRSPPTRRWPCVNNAFGISTWHPWGQGAFLTGVSSSNGPLPRAASPRVSNCTTCAPKMQPAPARIREKMVALMQTPGVLRGEQSAK